MGLVPREHGRSGLAPYGSRPGLVPHGSEKYPKHLTPKPQVVHYLRRRAVPPIPVDNAGVVDEKRLMVSAQSRFRPPRKGG